jgi:hypothetical protein
MGLLSMSDAKAKDHSDRQASQQPEKQVLNTPEGQQVRNASGETFKSTEASRTNASDGSLRDRTKSVTEQDDSVQILGMAGIAASRKNRLSEKDLTAKDPAARSIDIRELLAKPEKEAQALVEEFGRVTNMPAGPHRDSALVAVQQLADKTYGRGEYASKGLTDDALLSSNRPIEDYNYQVTKQEKGRVKALETGVAYEVGKPAQVTEQSLLERIGALPLDQQAQVIGAAIKAFDGELTNQQFRIGVGAITGFGDGVVGLAEGAESLGKTIIGVAQFSRDVMANDPAAVETAAKAGESLGKLMVGGVRVFSAANDYVESVGAATNVGDYGKPLRDVAWLGQQMNNHWESMNPEEKTRLVTKLAVENLGGMATGIATDKLAKSIKITEALEALGAEASTMGAGIHEKAKKLISGMADELLPRPMGVTPDGRLMPIPREPRMPETKMLMSKADDLGEKLPARPVEQHSSEIFELPKLHTWRDEFSIQASIPGFPNSRFRAEIPSPGIVHVSDIFTREAPPGTGSKFLAQALKDLNEFPTKELRFTNILEEATEKAFFAGEDASSSKLAHTATRALNKLGIEPRSYRWEVVRGKLNLVIDTK